MTPKPIHATFAMSPFLIQKLMTATIIGCRGACQAGLSHRLPYRSPCLTATRLRYRGVAPVGMEVLALSELEGTPMIAAPSRAAAAVTAMRAVLKFTGLISVSLGGIKGLKIGWTTPAGHT